MTKFLYGVSILVLSAGIAVAQSSPTDQGQAGSQNSSTPNQTTTTPDNSATPPSSQGTSSGQTGVSGQSSAPAASGQSTAPAQTTTQQSTTLADRVIANYRTPLPTVREAQWRMAREALAHVLSVSPDDAQVKGSLRYCDGHLHRINGDARKARKLTSEAQREFTDAVTAFREAAARCPARTSAPASA